MKTLFTDKSQNGYKTYAKPPCIPNRSGDFSVRTFNSGLALSSATSRLYLGIDVDSLDSKIFKGRVGDSYSIIYPLRI